ncbi:L domain-like protein [Rhizoclosmatium globosum]|uniref:L domain-like protein n=1 Tax=Rhizoclosmatium globosum TaxID=329046 RepID=A0A1Y2BV02_9FUNG|nr:L domain-like protein [Rhizoclosmatium globosum]|eukprot:ORY38608.1 L domain-like protein [Rhizoclosmatium globosum]
MASPIADCVSLLKAWPEIATTSAVTATNCCSAYGVTCNADNRIVSLSLNGYSYSTADLGVMTGIGGLQVNSGNPIPTALFELTQIYNLWMAGVGFTGPIPSGFSALTQLSEFHIESNKLTGGFPEDWAQLTSLRYFHADDNLLSVLPTTGSIASPSVLLKTCLIQNNRFTGTVPDEWVQGNLQYSWLDLYGNCLSGVSAQLNTRLCAVNCNWYDQQANCPGADTSFQSKCWEVVPSCPNQIQFPASGAVTIAAPAAGAVGVTSQTSVTTSTTTTTVITEINSQPQTTTDVVSATMDATITTSSVTATVQPTTVLVTSAITSATTSIQTPSMASNTVKTLTTSGSSTFAGTSLFACLLVVFLA